MAAVSAQKLSDESLVEATGKKQAEWHAVLDAAGAREWKHPVIAAWPQSEHGVGGWWAQSITVGYEQAIGRRLPGQTADGTFSVSVTKTINGSRAAVIDSAMPVLRDRLGKPSSESPDSRYATARWKVNGEMTVAAIEERKPGKTVVSLTRSKIIDHGSLAEAKSQLRHVLDAVAEERVLGQVD